MGKGGTRVRAIAAVVALAVAAYLPLSTSVACGPTDDAAAAAACAAICARTNCPMHHESAHGAGNPAPHPAPGQCCLQDAGGATQMMVVLAHAVGTMPPAVFRQIPRSASQPLAQLATGSSDTLLQIDAPPPRTT